MDFRKTNDLRGFATALLPFGHWQPSNPSCRGCPPLPCHPSAATCRRCPPSLGLRRARVASERLALVALRHAPPSTPSLPAVLSSGAGLRSVRRSCLRCGSCGPWVVPTLPVWLSTVRATHIDRSSRSSHSRPQGLTQAKTGHEQ